IFLYVYGRNLFSSIRFRCYNATTNSSLKLHSRQFFLCFHHFLLHLLHLLHHISHITFHVNSSFNIYDTSFLLFILYSCTSTISSPNNSCASVTIGSSSFVLQAHLFPDYLNNHFESFAMPLLVQE